MSLSVNTYLTFDGNCREAFEFYRAVFGGDFLELQTFADGPSGRELPEADGHRVMHVALPIGSAVLMGSDRAAGMAPPFAAGNNFSLSIQAESREQCDDLCARLSDGGRITMPLGEQFWGAYFGMWTDRFGIHWMVNYTLPQE